ncbi:preprotein translocase subunit SecY [Marchantia polymorpha subsp. ruderalis]|uniref:Uncharacterized protein n=2 Tax=Marchantia polymorpha TaxID=3197 RepID=A0AAF6AUW1_MARPO|nr:hypothetical protein MARPO_0002s0128 [Marchantia polymorpha]BBN00232.1 hypothetical protein Mp_1g27500 [Marchantia polymorpha subsp. ruderalis]|eukprot:PTQ49652.1 hypothetical protein MARPO_0002s0128 [Marchantia polymorpha]
MASSAQASVLPRTAHAAMLNPSAHSRPPRATVCCSSSRSHCLTTQRVSCFSRALNPAKDGRISTKFGGFSNLGFSANPSEWFPRDRVGRAGLVWRASVVSEGGDSPVLSSPPAPGKPFKNRLLGISKFGSVINDAAESFFKSEIRRRIFVTVALILASRVGYFIPIPGFDRRFMPGDYLALVSGAVEELGDLVSELKLAVFQLGISPYIFSSIVMQVACHLIPSLSKLRKEGLDGNEKIKKYTWWLALFIAVVESLVVSLHSAQYSLYSAENSLAYVMLTSGFLTLGAMSINWICEKITEAGFGQGSSLIICISILTGYSENLYRMISNLLNGVTNWVPLGLFLGCFILITMWAVIVTEGRRKVKLQYYDFELATSAGSTSTLPEVEPYIPFNINPTGMQPVLTTTYLMAVPAVIAGLTGNKMWIGIRDTLNPAFPAAPGAKPWLYYLVNAMFIFIFNVLDIMDTPKEVADYMMKIGARIPNIKPGRRTIEYLSKVQASTRFWGGLLLALLATVSTLVDYRFRSLHQGGTIGFTSMLIIVGSIVELRRSFMAYNVMPSLSKVLRRYGV